MKHSRTATLLVWFGCLLAIAGTYGVAYAGLFIIATALYMELSRRWIDWRYRDVERPPTAREALDLMKSHEERKKEAIAKQQELDRKRADAEEYARRVLDGDDK